MIRPSKILFFWLIIATAVFCKNSSASNVGGDRPNEVVFLQTDRDIYIAGEHLFFSVELINFPETGEALSEIAYVALRNQFGVIERISLNLSQNRFSGSLYLPDTLSTGYLELIGFTNWMRNFDETSFFKKTILVVNRFDKNLGLFEEGYFPEKQAKLRFFPEGGQLIHGKAQKILITTWPDSPLPNAEINIFSDSGDSLQKTSLNKMGWTTIDIIPEPGKRYFALVNGMDTRFYMPELKDPGYMLQISPLSQKMHITVASNSLSEQKLKLVMSKNGEVLQEYQIIVSSREPVFKEIIKNNIDHGFYVFSLIDNDGEILAERDWYVDRRTLARANVSLNKPAFGAREKVELMVQLEDIDDTIEWVTISVVQNTSKAPLSFNNLLFLKALDLVQEKGISLNEALRYLGIIDQEEINDLLIMPISPEVNSSSKLAIPFRYYRETSHLTVTGRITEATTQNPANKARVILNTPDTIVNLLYSNANHEGFFTFFLNSYYDDWEIFLTPDPGTISGDFKIEIFDKFDFKIPFKPETFSLPTSYREAIIENQKIVEINKAFGISAQIESPENTIRAEPPRVFSNPIYSINTEEFIPLENLQEIAREIIGPWRIRRTRVGTTHSLISNTTSNVINGVPVLFIDGIFTYDIEPLLPLNSRQIKNIQLLNIEWKHGDMHFPGIVALFTKNDEFRNLELHPTPFRFFNAAHQFPARLITPNHGNFVKQHSPPDLRQLLFWYSEKLNIGNRVGEFSWYTGDLPMDYIISIEGITQKGNFIKIEIPLLHEN